MECYFGEDEYLGSVPIDGENRDAFYVNDESQLSGDWLRWGVSADEFLYCFDEESADTESPQEPSTGDCSSLVGLTAGNSNAYLLNRGFKSDQPDYRLQNLSQSSSAQMDDIFLYSLFENESLLPEGIVDSNAACTDPDDTDLDNRATDYDIRCWSPENSAILGGSTISKAPTVLKQDELQISGEAGIATGEDISPIPAVIQDLEAAVRQLDHETRFCFRDAFYRLARNLTQRQRANEGGSMRDEDPMNISQRAECRTEKSSSMGRLKADVIDKIIAELQLDRTSSNLHP